MRGDWSGFFRWKSWNALAWTLLGLMLTWAMVYHWTLWRFPFELMPGEGALPYNVWLLQHGRNPYAFAEQPASMNVYGWVLPVLGWLLRPTSPSGTLVLLRSFNAVGILAAALGLVWAGRRMGADWFLACAAGVFFYASQLYYVGPMARVDGVAVALLLASTLLPWRGGFSTWSLLGAGLLALLGIYTKLYIGLAAVYVALGAFQARGWKVALAFLAAFAVAVGVSGLIVVRFFPAYFYDTVAIQLAVQTHKWGFMATQLATLAEGFLLVPELMMAWAFWGAGPRPKRQPWLLFSGLGLVFFVLVFGPNDGASLTYGLHLIAPFAWLGALQCGASAPWSRGLLVAALALQAWGALPLCLDPVWAGNLGQRSEIMRQCEAALSEAPVAWAPSDFNSVMLAQGKPIFDGGHAEGLARMGRLPGWAYGLFPRMAEWVASWQQAVAEFHRGVARRDYALIICQPGPYYPEAPLRLGYHQLGRIILPQPTTLERGNYEIWVRKAQSGTH